MNPNDETNSAGPNDEQKFAAPEPPTELVQAAEQNDSEAAYELGKFFLQSTPPEHDKAFLWMCRAHELGSDGALNGLGVCYLYGFGVEQNTEKALELLRQAVEKDVPNAFYNLGQCYFHGWGLRRNLKESMRLTRLAIDKGATAAALNFLAAVYLNSNSKRDKKIAFQYLLKSAETTLDPDQLYSLATCYLNGTGTKRNDIEAVRLLQLAWSPHMEYLLGWCYLRGRGIEKNLEQANHHFQAAAKMGCPQAECEWGYSLQKGRGTLKNRDEGRHWLIRAAEQDYPWDDSEERKWRWSLFTMCCVFCFWLIIPMFGAASLIDVAKNLLDGKVTEQTASRGISALFLLAGPVTFWYGVFRSLLLLRWGSVLMVIAAIEAVSELCWHWARQPGASIFNYLPLPLLILAMLVGGTIGTCYLTAWRTYWLELKRNKRDVSCLWPTLICSALYGLSLIVRHC